MLFGGKFGGVCDYWNVCIGGGVDCVYVCIGCGEVNDHIVIVDVVGEVVCDVDVLWVKL